MSHLQMRGSGPAGAESPEILERVQFLSGVPLLAHCGPQTLRMLAKALQEEIHPPTAPVVLEGDTSTSFFIVKSGEASVLKKYDTGRRRRIATLSRTDFFGELGILNSTARNATVCAGLGEQLVLYRFDREIFTAIIAPLVLKQREQQAIEERSTQLHRIPIFSDLSTEELADVAGTVEELTAEAGQTLFVQGDEADRFFLLIEGQVRVERDGNVVAELNPGDFFGETALLFTPRRTATVAASKDCVLWSIHRDSFEVLVRKHMMSQRDTMPTLLNRLHNV